MDFVKTSVYLCVALCSARALFQRTHTEQHPLRALSPQAARSAHQVRAMLSDVAASTSAVPSASHVVEAWEPW
ncbi:unnamed protein product [Boreogadus saida]